MHTGNISSIEFKSFPLAVYPCAYREHKDAKFNTMEGDGLSLCIQGTYTKPSHTENYARFIPVHTGNINALLTPPSGETVYPCAYREHLYGKADTPTENGLSLCIQGTCRFLLFLFNGLRFIPVHTGNISIMMR